MAPKPNSDVQVREVLFEFQRVGNYIRVSAIDTRSNTEIQIVGAPGYSEEMLKRLALRKLKYVLAKRRIAIENDPGTDDEDDGHEPDGSILA